MGRGSQTRTKKHAATRNRQNTTGKPDPRRQTAKGKSVVTGPSGQANYADFKAHKLNALERGELVTPSGHRRGRRNQAINLARREARIAGARDVPAKGKAEKTKGARPRPRRSKQAA
jgi:hypothetical protein